jgi:SAM-dependent methyltransferase
MDRVAEPELMLDPEQARAYALADFEVPHSRFVELLGERLPDLPRTGTGVDLGCGPGDIALRFARAFPRWNVDAVDGSPAMLALGRQAADHAGLAARVEFFEVVLPVESPPLRTYDVIFSNSLLHHLRDPDVIWSTARRWSDSNTFLFVMDLLRPASRDQARELVDRHARDEPEILRNDFFNSLLAAYRPPEIREQLARSSMDHLEVEIVSDRHLIVWGPCYHRESISGGSNPPADGAGG